jgi:DNA-binding transcriptional LysR family regulator
MRAKMQGQSPAGAVQRTPEHAFRWDDVRVFLAAYRSRSFGAASATVGLDVSTTSRRIAALEDSLGQVLFERTRQGLVATRAAELMLPCAETMEGAHAKLIRDLSNVESVAAGTVKLSVAPGFAELFVAPLLPALRAKYPQITIELDAVVRVTDLVRHEADLALRSVPPKGADLVVTKLAKTNWIAAGSRGLVAKLGRLASWRDAPWLNWGKEMAHFHAARWIAEHASDVPLQTAHYASQVAAAEVGLGLILLPDVYLHVCDLVPARYAPSLAPSTTTWPSDELWLVGHRALRDVPRVSAVWNFLAEAFRLPLGKRTIRSRG